MERTPSKPQDIVPEAPAGWVELRLLDAVERGRFGSQREAAAELGIALGLVNAYVKRCVRKGWLKVSEVPARRYAYYLTPQGFSEKARLSGQYLSSSMGLFRKARRDYAHLLKRAETLGMRRIVLLGASELAEIARLCALETEIEIVAIIDPGMTRARWLGVPVMPEPSNVADRCDGFVLATVEAPAAVRQRLKDAGITRPVMAPRFLERSLFDGEGGDHE
ncbi:MAG: winged helix-turn-helix transcriptional regulator [Salinarimonas sp.]|nr:winged helix-turn-helix transcriptional regulator [Salinarimonas sp.]